MRFITAYIFRGNSSTTLNILKDVFHGPEVTQHFLGIQSVNINDSSNAGFRQKFGITTDPTVMIGIIDTVTNEVYFIKKIVGQKDYQTYLNAINSIDINTAFVPGKTVSTGSDGSGSGGGNDDDLFNSDGNGDLGTGGNGGDRNRKLLWLALALYGTYKAANSRNTLGMTSNGAVAFLGWHQYINQKN